MRVSSIIATIAVVASVASATGTLVMSETWRCNPLGVANSENTSWVPKCTRTASTVISDDNEDKTSTSGISGCVVLGTGSTTIDGTYATKVSGADFLTKVDWGQTTDFTFTYTCDNSNGNDRSESASAGSATLVDTSNNLTSNFVIGFATGDNSNDYAITTSGSCSGASNYQLLTTFGDESEPLCIYTGEEDDEDAETLATWVANAQYCDTFTFNGTFNATANGGKRAIVVNSVPTNSQCEAPETVETSAASSASIAAAVAILGALALLF